MSERSIARPWLLRKLEIGRAPDRIETSEFVQGGIVKVRGGMLLARALREKGITQVFTLSGGFCNPLLEGLMECGIPVINTPHEQIAGHLADGTTRITRQPTVCLVGPEGFANAVPAMMEAWGARSHTT